MNPEPWLTKDFVEIFKGWDTKAMTMFEWGAGGSTLWFGERVKKLISVEHDPGWHTEVANALRPAPGLPVELFYIPLDDPLYLEKILEYPPFDCILIDGRNRVKCGFNAVNRLNPGGVLILDNAEREEYRPLIDLCDGMMERTKTTNGKWDTDFWRMN